MRRIGFIRTSPRLCEALPSSRGFFQSRHALAAASVICFCQIGIVSGAQVRDDFMRVRSCLSGQILDSFRGLFWWLPGSSFCYLPGSSLHRCFGSSLARFLRNLLGRPNITFSNVWTSPRVTFAIDFELAFSSKFVSPILRKLDVLWAFISRYILGPFLRVFLGSFRDSFLLPFRYLFGGHLFLFRNDLLRKHFGVQRCDRVCGAAWSAPGLVQTRRNLAATPGRVVAGQSASV